MDKVLDEQFDDKMKLTEDVEADIQKADDNKTAEVILDGQQEITLDGFGMVVFKMPPTGVALEGDNIYASFKAEHLRRGDFSTEAQLRAIYRQPTFIEQDGKSIEIGTGAWTDDKETRLDKIPELVTALDDEFGTYREEHQTKTDELGALKGNRAKSTKKKVEKLEKELINLQEQAKNLFIETSKLKIEQLELQNTKISLFSSSLEERANMEKIKYYIPYCVFTKDEETLTPMWKTTEDFLESAFGAIKILGIFNLFLRGADISFFGDMPEGAT